MSFNPPAGATPEEIEAQTAALAEHFGKGGVLSDEEHRRASSYNLPGYKPTARTHSYSDLGGYEPYDKVFTDTAPVLLTGWDKHFVLEAVEAYIKGKDVGTLTFLPDLLRRLRTENLVEITDEPNDAIAVFQLNRGDFEKECIKRGLKPLDFASWLVFHYYAVQEGKS